MKYNYIFQAELF